MMWRYWDGNAGGLGGWIIMGIGMLFVLVVVAAVVYAVIRLFSKEGLVRESSAADILRNRFAKGEIDEAEFKKRMEVLGQK